MSYNAQEVADRVGVTERAVRKRLGPEYIERVIANPAGSGRPIYLYSEKALAVWGVHSQLNALTAKGRKSRNDAGKVRGRNPEIVAYLTDLAFHEFMENAVQDARMACRRALKYAAALIERGSDFLHEVEHCAEKEWLYKAWVGRSDKYFRGPLYTQNWRSKHDKKWRQLKSAMSNGHVRYSMWEMFENSFDARRGSGAARFIMLDDRKGDAWTLEDGTQTMIYGIYAWDVLTGALLWVEPAIGSVDSNTYIRAVLGIVNAHGCDMPIFFMENAKAATAAAVGGTIRALYSDEEMEFLTRSPYKELWQGGPVGVVRNVPHIAHSFGKAFGERRFLYAKNWDASNFPKSYQGGSIHDGVQLRRANAPVLSSDYTPTPEKYFESLFAGSYTEYLDTPRDAYRNWAVAHGLPATIRSMVNYYTPSEKRFPTALQTAHLLYFASREKHVVKIKQPGSIRVTINHREYNLRSSVLYSDALVGKKVAVIAVPHNPDQCVIYKENPGAMPDVICIADDFTARSAEQMTTMRIESRNLREGRMKQLTEETEVVIARSGMTPGQSSKERLSAAGETRYGALKAISQTVVEDTNYEVVPTDEQLDDIINNSEFF